MQRECADVPPEVAALGARCREQGFAHPCRVLSAEGAAVALASLDDYTARCGGELKGDARFKLQLLFPWAADVVRNPAAVGLARAALQTDDVWCWSSDVNAKAPGTDTMYTWHQDSTFAGIDPPSAAVTVWIALTDSDESNGAVLCIPGSHAGGQLPHAQGRGGGGNALALGQEVTEFPPGAGPDAAVAMELQAGEASVHSFLVVHSSVPNRADRRRVGLAVRYVAASARKRGGRESATLVCGNGRGLFDSEPRPQREMGEAEVAAHAKAMALERANYFDGGAGAYN